jgi:hypothetical protein
VNFSFLGANRPLVAASALALVTGLVNLPAAFAQTPGQQPTSQQPAAGQQPAGQQPAQGQQPAAGQKNYKDRGEYDLYSKITQTQDPKAKLELLNTWQDKYPQSDFAQDRLLYYVLTLSQLAPSDPPSRQKLIDKANELLKVDPKNFRAMYLISVWGPAVGGANPSPDLLSQVDSAAHGTIENADTAFDPSKKPANVNEADFAKAKSQALGVAHNALAWEATAKKDNATAENEYKASLQANPDQGRISYLYAKLLQEEKKYPEALFEYARAGQYTGPDAVPASAQPQILDYFKKVYGQFHGSPDGADQVLAQAKTAALPPPDLKIEGLGDIEKAKADALNARMGSDPAFKLWYAIETSLKDQGDTFFNSNVKEHEIPGGAEGVKTFSGTVISSEPTKITLGVEDPTKADATLEFSQPLSAAALDKVKAGDKIEFSGVADSYTKDPYMLTFKDPSVPGLPASTPAKRPAPARRRPRG